MSTIYRKHRPKDFNEAVGQNHIKITLQNQIKNGDPAHSYLFCGPRGVGKTTFARLLAKSLNCEQRKDGDGNPCNKCKMCEEINLGKALDIIEIDAASHTGVDNVRENIIVSAGVSPARANYKVFIIDEVHMLSISAFNALLKILEEPPSNVIFILCTTEIHKMPLTIISRCQRFDFKKISVEDIKTKLNHIISLEKIKAEKGVLEKIARHSGGHMRDAESVLGQIIAISDSELTIEKADLIIPRSDLAEVVALIEFLAKKDIGGALALINKLSEEGLDFKVFSENCIEVMRKTMIAKLNPKLMADLRENMGEDLELKLNQAVKDLPADVLPEWIEIFMEAKNKIKDSFLLQMPLELAATKICLVKKQVVNPVVSRPTENKAQNNYSPNQSLAKNKIQGELDVARIVEYWNEVLVKVKKYNHSLSFILRVCKPRDVSGNKLCLAFKHKFHKDRLDQGEIKKLVEKVLADVYGTNLEVEAVIDEGLDINEISQTEVKEQSPQTQSGEEKNQSKENDAMSNILKTFGGKVVR